MIGNQTSHVEVTVDSDLLLQQRIKQLEGQLAAKNKELNAVLNLLPEEHRGRKQRDVTPETQTYNPVKSNGVTKATAAESIRSYTDFKMMQDYFLDKHRVRDWALWTVGVSLGLRISDLLSLKFENVLEKDGKTFRPRIKIYEIKTGKLNDILITESVVDALTKYCEAIKWQFDLNDYIFFSHKTGGKMYEEHGWRIINQAGKDLRLPIHISSHTMRKSFANIVACMDTSIIDMNSITKIQGLLNHSSQASTMKYLGVYKDMYDKARIVVSNFVLGKYKKDDLFIDSNPFSQTMRELMEGE